MKKLFAFLFAIVAAMGCSSTAEVSTSSQFSTRVYPLHDFTGLDVSNVKVVYTQGDAYSVSLTGRTDWLDKMEVATSQGKLKVALKVGKELPNGIRPKDQPDGQHNFILRLTAPRLEDICITGVSIFQTTNMTAERLRVVLRGVSKLEADNIAATNLHLSLSGSSVIRASAITCETCNAESSGASKITLDSLFIQERATFDVRGASTLTLAAMGGDLCIANFSGASKGDISYIRGGALRTECQGASKLEASLDCQSVHATSDGASKIILSGTADKVEVERGNVATSIDTTHLNQF